MSIITEIKKFNRKYTIITHMQDSALPADSEVLLEGVVVVYTPTGELKDAEKCKVGDGVTEFCNLPWLGDSIEVEDLTAELQRQDELLTEIENLISTTNKPEPVEAMWYFTYNTDPGVLRLENGELIASADPWGWASTDGTHTFDISPLDGGIALQNLDTSKVYKCISNVGAGGDYAELVYGVPEKAWRLFATEEVETADVTHQLNDGWSWPYIKDGILYSDYLFMAIYKNTGYGLGEYIVTLDGTEEPPYTFSLENLSTTETYNICHDIAAGYVHTFTLKYDYPVIKPESEPESGDSSNTAGSNSYYCFDDVDQRWVLGTADTYNSIQEGTHPDSGRASTGTCPSCQCNLYELYGLAAFESSCPYCQASIRYEGHGGGSADVTLC